MMLNLHTLIIKLYALNMRKKVFTRSQDKGVMFTPIKAGTDTIVYRHIYFYGK